jgi:hypothetical protein
MLPFPSSWAGRDRTAARATLGGEFPARALSIREVGSSFLHGPRFRRPPCAPGRSDVPRPVLTLASLRSPSHRVRSFSADPHTPLPVMVCFQGRSIVHRPDMSGYSWSCHVPRAPLHDQGVTSLVVVSWTTSAGVTPPSSLLRAHAPVLNPPRASVCPSNTRSVQVAVSPCWEEDLPGVLSAHLSLRAWTSTPAAPVVLMPVSSHGTTAFPTCGTGRHSTLPIPWQLPYGALVEAAVIRSSSGPQSCSPSRLPPQRLQTGGVEAAAPANPCNAMLTHPAPPVQTAQNRATPGCAPLWKVAGCRKSSNPPQSEPTAKPHPRYCGALKSLRSMETCRQLSHP